MLPFRLFPTTTTAVALSMVSHDELGMNEPRVIEVRASGGCHRATPYDSRTALLLSVAMLLLGSADATVLAASAAEPARLRVSIPGLGSSSYPIMAQKKGYFRA
jgi:hypothetical protein